MSVIISPEAAADIQSIALYGALRFGVLQAENYHQGLSRVFALLDEHPRLAPFRDDLLGIGCRVFSHKAHVVIYVEDGNNVFIIRILDSRRDWANLLD